MASTSLQIAGVVAVLGLLGIRGLLVSGASAVHGIEIGMTPTEVVERFDVEAGGQWSESAGCDGRALEWSRGEATLASVPLGARFEFHDGLLVAARMRLSREDLYARGGRLETSAQVVLAREEQPDGSVALVLIARGCAKRAAEVVDLLGGGPVRR
jgi:hypothetical protein